MHEKSQRQIEIETRLEELDVERIAKKKEGSALKAELHAILEEEQADQWGVTVEQYRECKSLANPTAELQREYDVVRTKKRKLQARADDQRKPQELRDKAAEELPALDARMKEIDEHLDTALKTPPVVLTTALRTKRAENRREIRKSARNAQSATAQMVSTKTEAKGSA